MPLISVIVPVYKVEPYLHRCVDSILAQTFTNFELILVDDGSPDNCGVICDEYAALDSRIQVIHKENYGVSSARNAGLDAASGEYIFFCDGDDYIEKTLLMEAVQAMDGYDMVVFNYAEVDADSEKKMYVSDFHLEAKCWDNMEEKSRFLTFDFFSFKIGFAVWCRLFRKAIIDKFQIRFPEKIIIAEDLSFDLCYLLHSNSFRTISGVYYFYCQHSNSVMGRQKERYNFDNNNEVSKFIWHHLTQCSESEMLEAYYPLIHYGVMNNVISRAREMRFFLGFRDIRTALMEEIQDTTFFFERTREVVDSNRLFVQEIGTIRARLISSEWGYYLDGKAYQLLFATVCSFPNQVVRMILKRLHLSGLLRRVRRALK